MRHHLVHEHRGCEGSDQPDKISNHSTPMHPHHSHARQPHPSPHQRPHSHRHPHKHQNRLHRFEARIKMTLYWNVNQT